MSRVLLTGAAGFIGSHVARLLVAEGHDVFAIVAPESDRWRLADIEHDIVIIDADLRALQTVRGRLREVRPEICVHLAWRGWSGKANPDDNISSLGVSLELLRMMPELSCGRFVAVGTCFEYAPTAERLTEATPLCPHELYGTCKKALFEVAEQFSMMTGVSIVTPRVFYSYGPFEDIRRLVPSVACALLDGRVAEVTPGAQIRDYLHVEDVASAVWKVAASQLVGAVNVASAEPVTVGDIADRVGRLIGRPDLVRFGAIPYRPGEPAQLLGDATRLREEVGWAPRFDLDHGLAATVRWWESRRGRS